MRHQTVLVIRRRSEAQEKQHKTPNDEQIMAQGIRGENRMLLKSYTVPRVVDPDPH